MRKHRARKDFMEYTSDCLHNEACWGIEGVQWTYGCPSCGRVGYGPTLKLAREAFAVNRELIGHYPNKEAGGLGDATASNGAPTDRKEESDDDYAGYFVRGIHGGED